MRDRLADERLVRRVELLNAASLALLTGGAWWLFSLRAATGVFLGGVIAIASFRTLEWQLKKAFSGKGPPPGKGGLLIVYYLRYLCVLFLIFLIIYYGWVHPVALVVGLSVVVIGILLVGAHEAVNALRRGER